MSNNYYPPANFAKEAVKEIRIIQNSYRINGLDDTLLDSELEGAINDAFKQSICDNCELRMLFDANERVSKELYDLLKEITQIAKDEIGTTLFNKSQQLIKKYKNLES